MYIMNEMKQISAILMSLIISAGAVFTVPGSQSETEMGVQNSSSDVHLLHPVIQEVSQQAGEKSDGEYGTISVGSSVIYPQISLSDEEKAQYPDLSQTLDAYNAGKKNWYHSQLTSLADAAEEMAGIQAEGTGTETGFSQPPVILTQEADAQIGRADSVLFSVIEHFSSYSGGAHGYYEDAGNTFDSQSGRKLSFADVVTDCDSAAAYVYEKLAQAYPDLQPEMSQADIAADMKGIGNQTGQVNAKGEMFTESSDQAETYIRWYVTDLGVMVIFPPYTLGSYAEGQQKVLLSYAEYPEIFNPKYAQVPDSFITPFDEDTGAKIDVNGDGTLDQISVSSTMDENGDYAERVITVNDTDHGMTDTHHFLKADCYLIKARNRVFLYCFDYMENDYVELYAYLFTGDVPEAVFPGTGTNADAIGSDIGNLKPRSVYMGSLPAASLDESYTLNNPLTDPDAMILSSRMDALSTYDAYRTYSASESTNGYPVPLDLAYWIDSDTHVTLRKTVNLTLVGGDGNGTGQKEFPAETSFSLYQTDGLNYVDLQSDADSSIVRVNGSFAEWPHTVEGMQEDELFRGMMYAG